MLRKLTASRPFLGAALLLGVLLAASPSAAQALRSSGVMAKGAWPLQDLSETNEFGAGFSFMTRSHIGHSRLWYHGQGSYLKFPGKELTQGGGTVSAPDIKVYGLSLGLMARLTDRLHLGAEGGYYFGDDHSWGVTPFASAINGNLELMVEYKLMGDTRYWGVSVGYYVF
jgi:hypothetical protein